MEVGSIYHGDIIAAFTRNVPDCYVRDYSANRGFLTICRGYKNIPWKADPASNRRSYVSVPAETLLSIPRGQVKAADTYRGMDLVMPGWRKGLRDAIGKLTYGQRVAIQRDLRRHVWADIAPWR